MPLQATSGAASYDAFGGGVAAVPNYIEDVFQTWLYTGNDSTQTITNGIDLSGKGGMVWLKSRNQTYDNALFDTNRGATKWIQSNGTDAETTTSNSLTSFNSNGFTLGDHFRFNAGFNYASWTFREQPKFFDVVTFTAPSTTATSFSVPHSLGSTPGCCIIKRTDSAEDWFVYHRSLANPARNYLVLNSTAAAASQGSDAYAPTSTEVTLLTGASVSASGQYVMYLFAHNAGGFGLTGTDNVISCGSFTGNGSTSGPEINLGYEPQWIMIKNASAATNWRMFDNMRGMPVSGSGNSLEANTSAAEAANDPAPIPTATGFRLATTNSNLNGNGNTMIYIAIRRGPMKVPTTGTSVFAVDANDAANPEFTSGFPVDAALLRRVTTTSENYLSSRLTGANYMFTESIDSESSAASFKWDYMNGWLNNFYTGTAGVFSWMWRRAPGFFDVVCYTGT
jgi:hypothetical protein